jgi:hypothetical protein
MAESFNLLTEKWIPVIWKDGRRETLGILGALRNARAIGAVDEPFILERFALTRLLLAFVHWRHTLQSCEEWPPLWERRELPGAAMADLNADDHAHFNLLGEGGRFFQDSSASRTDAMSVNNLFADLPAGTNINHLAHVCDDEAAVCPACAARALACLPAFCTQGGAGKSPSINGAPPIYFMPVGTNLCETLLLNLPVAGTLADWPVLRADEHPAWDRRAESTAPIGFCEGLTWQPRRVYLKAERRVGSRCIRCGGAPSEIIRKIVYAAGRSLEAVEARGWRDPHSALSVESQAPLRALDETKKKTRDAASARWQREVQAILSLPEDGRGPPAIRQAARLLAPGESLRVLVVRHPTSQMKRLDADACVWRVPLSVLRTADLHAELNEELEELSETAGHLPKSALRVFHYAARREFQRALLHADGGRNPRAARLQWHQVLRTLADEALARSSLAIKQAWNVLEVAESTAWPMGRICRSLDGAERGKA